MIVSPQPPALLRLLQHPFWIVLGGTSAAQIIAFLSAPLLTRLYSPEAFGLLSLFAATLSVMAGSAGARYEQAIVSQVETRNASHLIVLTALCAAILIPLTAWLAAFLPLDRDFSFVLPYVLPSAFFYVVSVALNNWLIRDGALSIISAAKVLQALVVLAVSLAMSNNFEGMLMAALAGYVAIAVGLGRGVLQREGFTWGISVKELLAMAKKNRSFPLFGMMPAIFDSLATLLPVYFLSYYFSQADVGAFGLVKQVIAGPLGMFGAAVSVILTKTLADAVLNGEGVLHRLCRISGFFLCPLMIIPVAVSYFGPGIFEVVFGPEWRQSGALAQWLVWAFVVSMFASAMSATLIVLRKTLLNGVWQFAHFCAILLLCKVTTLNDVNDFVKRFVVVEVVSCALYAFMSLYAAYQHGVNNDRKVTFS